ncbi:DUF5057 domain-containing protein [Coprococcus eutactus]|uniref:DUF5057 domain-containing protein n=1 Tax=Coprococcus eutactus TaxID=33043 RepID=UPI0011C79750|nr:DUF5057 domain-containing protein [Coprococcus eutactus]MCB6628915.1 DUF5057 domain-containing protein [Coprococcus eutactus]MCG4789871.1 DUF5057 domain-containing protein [Coprococcus eutactus]MCQ5118771.1 DUF5057 domain-containing protein [Coprococcus eutactus]MCQ5132739.1 DUF5057 domain-containing protein [Coprococcus eutactus]MCQ5134987.1 DUF5057 domain-containing protein [Coprococcus eutactus]
MFKNKKIVLSSIAIIFALVVSSIFVNYTLANSDSQASVSDATGSGTTTGLTGLSNIDLAIENSNNAGKKATGEDKYRIVQIVSDDYAANAAMDTQLKETVSDAKFTGDAKKLTGYESTTYLWRYVYAGEYFRLAVFNGYKTITDNMAEGAVTLTTCTVSELNKMDKNAQGILNQADFIYIWANGASDYASKSNDLSEELYNWLDSYATANSHPIAMCTGTLCTSEPGNISGNNDDFRMGALAYKLITKGAVARYDNVLVTDADFFKTLYEEADDNNEHTPDIEKTTYTISDFILKAERTASQGGSDYLNFGTYYKWYDGVSITDFLDGNIPDNITDSTYDKAGSRSGLTGDRKEWNFDNAKVLIISEDGANSAMFTEMKEKNSGNSAESAASDYKFDKKTQTWKSVEKAPNSELTGHMYANGTSASGTGISKYVPSGADIYVLDSANIVDALTNGGVPYSNMALSNSAYMDVKTKTVSGTVRLTDMAVDDDHALAVEDVNLSAYLVVDNGSELHLAGTSADEMMMCPLTKQEQPKLDTNGDELTDDDGNTIMETVYTYSFPKLDPSYNYKVVIGGDDGFSADDYTVGMAQAGEDSSNGGTQDNADADNVYDFIIKAAEEDNVDGYTFRKDAEGNEDATVVVTRDDFNESVDKPDLGAVYKSDLIYTGFDLSDESKIAEYVKSQHDAYVASQTGLVSDNPDKVDLTQFDFVFIDKGTYNKEIGQDVFKALTGGVESGQYFIVSSKAGDGKGSNTGDGGGNDKPGITVITSPSAKAIADVINASVYRDGADNKFKVLEIQPNYPIDLEVAALNQTVETAYKTRSDGTTPITGNYYTVPSDVVSGKSKEELSAKTEYYDFDLTKAKIAYAVDGLSYGDISLTQVSTEQLIGMKENIAATYDLVYIGGDISAMDRNPAEMYKGQNDIGNSTPGYTYQIFPTFIMYYHTGTLSQLMAASTYSPDTAPISGSTEMMATPCIGNKYYKTTYLAENGNDLTKTKYDELISYMASGKPVMVSDELTSVYENMQGTNADGQGLSEAELLQGYWYKNGNLERTNYYLDPSSRMYSLVGSLYTRHNSQSGSNVLWGFNSKSTQYISDKDGKYGNSLWTMYVPADSQNGSGIQDLLDSDAQKKAWYKETSDGTIYYNYKLVWDDVTCASVNRLVTGSAHRTRLTVTEKPVTYQQGIETTYIKSNRMPFTFRVDGDDASYNYKLFVDVDKNTKFESSGKDICLSSSLQNGVDKSVTVTLDTEFFGSAAWYLEITNTSGDVIATANGLSKIVNNKTELAKNEINVLQVQTMAEGQGATSWGATDTLYFDIESQTAHKIAKYNVFANMVELDNASTTQYEVLGRHENRFGIYEFDTDTDADDYYSNLADEISDDYDINLDLVVASKDKAEFTTGDGKQTSYACLDTMVEEAEILANGGKVDNMSQEDYANQATVALAAYTKATSDVVAPKKALDTYLTNAIAYMNGTYTGSINYQEEFLKNFKTSTDETKQVLQYIMDTGDYYIIFWPKYNTMNHCEAAFKNHKMSNDYGDRFKTLYEKYVEVKDKEIEAKEKYNTYLRRSYGKDFMKKMYSILVLGPSDSFGGFKVDFQKATCQYILDYVSYGGDLFFFHDSMSPYANAGAVNLTRSLLSVVGMNRFHVDITNDVVSYSKPISLGEYTVKNVAYSKASVNTSTLDVTYTPDGTVDDVTYTSPDTSLYYMTPYVNNSAAGEGLLNSMNSNIMDIFVKKNAYWQPYLGKEKNLFISPVAMTALYYNGNMAGATTTLPYVYAQESFKAATAWSQASNQDQSACAETVKATQLNSGLVTLYPYNISSSLNISGTHQQAYALDLESNNITVWYTLAGSNNSSNSKMRSSKYAADPGDAMEAYYIYTTAYGSGAITYCGSGHSSVTGRRTRNNDERKLFINVIVNSATAVPDMPTIKCYDPVTTWEDKDELTKDEEILATSGRTVYNRVVDAKTDAPTFDYKIGIPENTKITKVNIFYDLNLDEESLKTEKPSMPVYEENVDKMILSYDEIGGKKVREISKQITDALRDGETRGNLTVNLKPNDTYFAAYDGTHTYIVVQVEYQGMKAPVYTIIRVKASDPLFDLTDNTIDVPAYDDFIAEKKRVFA